ncbi:MAG: T9SS type A sorting domain-containing protein [Saprospiraceae bacterium]|jgi:hypothetical protein|nr:T9SS type A sorting domain-containing protein [Saprospiraceae bacterium]
MKIRRFILITLILVSLFVLNTVNGQGLGALNISAEENTGNCMPWNLIVKLQITPPPSCELVLNSTGFSLSDNGFPTMKIAAIENEINGINSLVFIEENFMGLSNEIDQFTKSISNPESYYAEVPFLMDWEKMYVLAMQNCGINASLFQGNFGDSKKESFPLNLLFGILENTNNYPCFDSDACFWNTNLKEELLGLGLNECIVRSEQLDFCCEIPPSLPQIASINSFSRSNQDDTYPNPFNRTLNIRLIYSDSERKIEIFNTNGQKTFEQKINKEFSGNIKIDLSAIPNGFYFCKIQSLQETKIIKILKE